jgi:hypothetical protein
MWHTALLLSSKEVELSLVPLVRSKYILAVLKNVREAFPHTLQLPTAADTNTVLFCTRRLPPSAGAAPAYWSVASAQECCGLGGGEGTSSHVDATTAESVRNEPAF